MIKKPLSNMFSLQLGFLATFIGFFTRQTFFAQIFAISCLIVAQKTSEFTHLPAPTSIFLPCWPCPHEFNNYFLTAVIFPSDVDIST
jgi:hypothetical protein